MNKTLLLLLAVSTMTVSADVLHVSEVVYLPTIVITPSSASPTVTQQNAAAIMEDSIESLPAEATIAPYIIKDESVAEDATESLPSGATVGTFSFDPGVAEDAM